ncbi:MAG: hypothetical protein CL916_05590 [Deltaproteobacteria bacterium]|nr:hypothetical protein [Deltaproteobacteria bacterium]
MKIDFFVVELRIPIVLPPELFVLGLVKIIFSDGEKSLGEQIVEAIVMYYTKKIFKSIFICIKGTKII